MQEKEPYSKTKTSFYRRLYVAHLIDTGINTVPAICEASGMHRRTAQDTIQALQELDISCEFIGEKRNGNYAILNWEPIEPKWISQHIMLIKGVLQYP